MEGLGKVGYLGLSFFFFGWSFFCLLFVGVLFFWWVLLGNTLS